jgi:hypothetical protein
MWTNVTLKLRFMQISLLCTIRRNTYMSDHIIVPSCDNSIFFSDGTQRWPTRHDLSVISDQCLTYPMFLETMILCIIVAHCFQKSWYCVSWSTISCMVTHQWWNWNVNYGIAYILFCSNYNYVIKFPPNQESFQCRRGQYFTQRLGPRYHTW